MNLLEQMCALAIVAGITAGTLTMAEEVSSLVTDYQQQVKQEVCK